MSESQDAIQRAAFRIAAAATVLEARKGDLDAALMVGTPEARRQARDAVLAAMDAWMDRKEEWTHHFLIANGINPDSRG